MQRQTSVEYIFSIFIFEQFINPDLHYFLINTSFPVLCGLRIAVLAIFSSTAVTRHAGVGPSSGIGRRTAGPKPPVERFDINRLRLDSLPGLSPLLSMKRESRKHVAVEHSFGNHTLYS